MIARSAALAFLAGTAGCSSTTAATPAADGGGQAESGLVSCAADPRVDPYALPLSKAGKSHALTFVIIKATADPPAEGNQSIKVKVLDGAGQPVMGATVSFPPIAGKTNPYMPDHVHGSANPQSTDNGDGTYTIAPLYFYMGGVWQVAVQAQTGNVTDSAMFTFCIP